MFVLGAVREFVCVIEAFSQQPASGGFCAPRCVQIKENSPIIIPDPKVQFRERYMGELVDRVQKSILWSLYNRNCHSHCVLMRPEMFSSPFFLNCHSTKALSWLSLKPKRQKKIILLWGDRWDHFNSTGYPHRHLQSERVSLSLSSKVRYPSSFWVNKSDQISLDSFITLETSLNMNQVF